MLARGICVFIIVCGLLWVAGPSSAARRAGLPSAGDLTERLEGFRDTFSRLEAANSEFLEYNRNLKAHLEQGKSEVQSLKKQHDELEKEAQLYAVKTQKKSAELISFETKKDETKARMQSIEQDIVMKQLVMHERMRRQQAIWEQLAAINNKDGVAQLQEHNTEALAQTLKEKVELSRQLKESQGRLADLEAQVAYQSILRQDPSVSLPKLTAERDHLNQKFSVVSADSVLSPPVDFNQLKKLNFEVNELAKRRSDQTNLLQMLDSQYDKNEKLTKNSPQEKKLQESIAVFKKDNKLLRQQAADLRFEMVDLDKRKARLERVVKSSK